MNDVDTIDGVVKRATRRRHSTQFKAKVLGVPAIRRVWRRDLEAVQPERVVVHRWRADVRKAALPKSTDAATLPMPDFIALHVQPEAQIQARDIRVELKRGSSAAVVHWPVE